MRRHRRLGETSDWHTHTDRQSHCCRIGDLCLWRWLMVAQLHPKIGSKGCHNPILFFETFRLNLEESTATPWWNADFGWPIAGEWSGWRCVINKDWIGCKRYPLVWAIVRTLEWPYSGMCEDRGISREIQYIRFRKSFSVGIHRWFLSLRTKVPKGVECSLSVVSLWCENCVYRRRIIFGTVFLAAHRRPMKLYPQMTELHSCLNIIARVFYTANIGLSFALIKATAVEPFDMCDQCWWTCRWRQDGWRIWRRRILAISVYIWVRIWMCAWNWDCCMNALWTLAVAHVWWRFWLDYHGRCWRY